MTSKQKFTVVLLTVLVAAVAFGAYKALAQDSGNATPTPYSPGTPGYGWNIHGMMWDGPQNDPMWTAVARALDIDVNTLFTELQSGKTLAQIAEERGVDVQTVYDAALTTMTDHMNAMVGAGYITQAQADTHLTWMRDNMAQMPMFDSASFGFYPMGGMMGSYGPGMMGHGMMGYGPQGNRMWQDHGGWMGPMHGWGH